MKRRSERGAVLPMAAAGIVIAMIASALAVDLGMLASDRRTNQKVADLAALDAVRVLPADPQPAARISATRNQFPTGTNYDVVASPLNDAGAVVAAASATKVRVTVSSPRRPAFPFVGNDERIVSAKAVARISPPIASFTIGSSVATFDSTRSQILNALLNSAVCPPAPAPPCNTVSLTAIGYQGLASSNVNLDSLRTKMGFGALTPSQVLTQNFSAADLVTSTADVLSNDPSKAQAVADLRVLAAALRTRANPVPPMNFGQLLTVTPGSEGSALASSFNVLQLVNGTAQFANGTNAVSIPNLSITLPLGLTSVDASVTLISKPVTYVGPAPGVTVSTNQASVTVTAKINVLGVQGDIPITLTGGGASANLASITCSGPSPSIGVHVQTAAASVNAVTTLNALGLPLLKLALNKPLGVASSSPDPTTFSYPTEFAPQSKHVGSTTLGLGGGGFGLSAVPSGNPITDALVAPLTLVGGAFDLALRPILDNVDNLAIRPIMQALGLDIGAADVTANFITPPPPACSGGQPTLVE